MSRRLLPVLLTAVLLLSACGGEAGDDAQPSPTPAPQDLGAKPAVTVPDEPAAETLQVETLAEGEGEQVSPGDTVTVHYVGVAYSTGEQFDASWDRNQPFSFEVGAGGVIPGWELGIGGTDDIEPMRVGERRRLIIPPDLAYADRGAGGVIGPGETLIFVVDLLDIDQAS